MSHILVETWKVRFMWISEPLPSAEFWSSQSSHPKKNTSLEWRYANGFWVNFADFRPWGWCGMSPEVSAIAESPRNERIGPSTLICAAVRLHRRSDGDSTTRQRWSMSGRNPGFNRILKEIHQNGLSHYALRQPTKFGCVKLCTYLLRAAAKLSKSLANLECLIDF